MRLKKKKNSEHDILTGPSPDFIAPASFFKGNNALQKKPKESTAQEQSPAAPPTPVEAKNKEEQTHYRPQESPKEVPSSDAVVEPKPETEPQPETPPIKKLNIGGGKRVSGLSLSSLKIKKEHELSRKDETIDESKLPKDPFTEEEMQKHWADFVDKIDLEGKKILASNLNADVPKLLQEKTIWIELPNGTMKKEIEREQYDLMEYLRKKLNNYFIELKITVNETVAKKFAFTPEEKYQKLREKNPAIDLLRQTFDLDL